MIDTFNYSLDKNTVLPGETITLSYRAQEAKNHKLTSVSIWGSQAGNIWGIPAPYSIEAIDLVGDIEFTPYYSGEVNVTAEFVHTGMSLGGLCPFPPCMDYNWIRETGEFDVVVDITVTVDSLAFGDLGLQDCLDSQSTMAIQDVTSLDCTDYNITDITELRYFQNIESLNLSNTLVTSSVEDSLEVMSGLKNVDLSGTGICPSVDGVTVVDDC